MSLIESPDVTMSSIEVADLVGVSYRMLDYWLREGHVTLACDPQPGSGRRRVWTQDEVTALRLFVVQYRKLQEFQETFRDGHVWDQAIREAEAASA